MFSSNSIKFFFGLAFALSVFSSCGWREVKTETPTPFASEESKSEIPFVTKEPENFQAEFTVTSNGFENKTFVARNGNSSRYDYAFETKNQLTVLQSGANQSFIILPAKKIYAENSALAIADAQTAENFKDFPINELLNHKADAKYTNLGAENGLTKYRVSLDDSENAETIIFVDEKIGLPVRQEFYSSSGEQKTLTFTFEMRHFKTQTENILFEIPKDFRKVSLENLQAAML
jgi:outer membrane lipoprotein-sorting protein